MDSKGLKLQTQQQVKGVIRDLKIAADATGKSVTELAKDARVSRPHLSNFLNGKGGRVSLEFVCKLAAMLEISVSVAALPIGQLDKEKDAT